jgi:hypothetical protein
MRKALRKRHAQDNLDFFATDPNSDIRTLGRLALRRDDINDLFALGDLCAKRALSDDQRLLVFYVGKALIAYQRALESARNDIDRNLARRAIRDLIAWTAAIARENPSRRNIATSLWAIAEYEPDDRTNPGAVSNEAVFALLSAYRPEPLTTTDGDESHTVADVRAPSSESLPTTGAFSSRSADLLSDDGVGASETRMEQSALDLFTSVERDGARSNRLAPSPIHELDEDIPDDDFSIGDYIEDQWEVADVRRGGMGVVYLCYDHKDREPVAIKTFQSRFLENERAVARFVQEALTWIRLEKHRHIVQARLVTTIRGRPHIILSSLSSLACILRWGCNTPARKCRDWCTATSSLPTSWSRTTASPRSPISGWCVRSTWKTFRWPTAETATYPSGTG